MVAKVKKLIRFKPTLVRYVSVGIVSVAVDYGLMIVLYRLLHVPLAVAASTGFLCGLGVNFLLNKYWAFQAERGVRQTARQAFLVGLLVIGNLVFTNLFIVLLAKWWIAPEFSKPVATALTTLWNYVLYQKVIFKAHSPTDLERSMM